MIFTWLFVAYAESLSWWLLPVFYIGWILLSRYLMNLNLFLIAGLFAKPGDFPKLSASQRAKTIFLEYIAYLLPFSIHMSQPWRYRSSKYQIAKGKPQQTDTAIVLIHGFLSNAGIWHKLMARGKLSAHCPVIALNMDPFYWRLDAECKALAVHLEHLRSSLKVKDFVLVGHSMGGVLARIFLKHPDNNFNICKVFALGGPHYGTRMAKIFPGSDKNGPPQPNAAWLAKANIDVDEVGFPPVQCYVAEQDEIVVPPNSARLPGQTVTSLPGMAHLDLCWRTEFLDTLEHDVVLSIEA